MAIGARGETRPEVDGNGPSAVDTRAISSRVAILGRVDGCDRTGDWWLGVSAHGAKLAQPIRDASAGECDSVR